MAPDPNIDLDALGRQLLSEVCVVETAIARLAVAVPPAVMDLFIERAIDQILVNFARSTRGPGAPMVHAALDRRLREGVRRRLEDLRGSAELKSFRPRKMDAAKCNRCGAEFFPEATGWTACADCLAAQIEVTLLGE